MARKQAVTLEAGIRQIIQEHYKGTKSEKTSVDRLYEVGEFLGMETPLASIRARDVHRLKQHLKDKGNSTATVNRKLSVLSKLLSTACDEWEVIENRPRIKLEKEDDVEVHLLTDEEEQAMIRFFDEKCPLMKSMCVILIDSGCRLSEIINLHAKYIKWDKGLFIARDTKNGTISRPVAMTKRVRQELHELVIKQGQLQPFVEHKRDWYRYRWDAFRDSMGFHSKEGFKIHCLRHTCATRLLKAGVKIEVVAEWLGHSTLDMTRRYYRFMDDDLNDAVKMLEGR